MKTISNHLSNILKVDNMARCFSMICLSLFLSVCMQAQHWSLVKDTFQIGEPVVITYQSANKADKTSPCVINLSAIKNQKYATDTMTLEPFADVEVDQQSLNNISVKDTLLVVNEQATIAKATLTFYSIGDFIVGCDADSFIIHVAMLINMKQQPTQEIKDIKPIIEVNGIDWWFWVIIFFIVAIIAALVYFIGKKLKAKKPGLETGPSEVVISPEYEARQALQALIETRAYASNDVKVFQTKMTEILKKYLIRKYNINAYEMTSDELLEACKPFNIKHLTLLSQILSVADQVKFAKARAGQDICREAIDKGLEFITDKHV